MKKDMEYNIGREYTQLPDEYLQGGGSNVTEVKTGKAPWKKMMYMAAAFLIMTYAAVFTYTSDAADVPVSGNPMLIVKSYERILEKLLNKETPSENKGQTEVIEEPTIPTYPLEHGTCSYVIYNDTIDINNNFNNRILGKGVLSEEEIAGGLEYVLPEHEPEDGFIFMGWVIYHDKSVKPPSMGMAGNSLSSSNICYVKPENNERSIEVHAAWRYDGMSEWPYLLTLDANGGTIENETAVSYDAKGPMYSDCYVYLCAYPEPVREGYTFTGWYTSPDTSEGLTTRIHGLEFYAKNGNEYDWSTMNPITLYAGWKKIR
ncbi:MAG: InlB B-repeat-containing protein [Lachnospiraceae bacterium]